MSLRIILSLLLILSLAGCAGTKLKQTEISSEEIKAEERLQKKFAEEQKHQLRQRLKKIEAKLAPEVRKLCSYLSEGKLSGCYFPVELDESRAINAHTDGKKVVINKGIMTLLDKDEELAVVIGHEYAHALLRHVNSSQTNFFIGLVFDALIAGTTGVDTNLTFAKIGQKAFSKDFESEADYAGLYIAYRAGFDVSKASNVWRKMAVENTSSIVSRYNSTHPSSPKRFLAQGKTYTEILDKDSKNIPLLPDKLAKIEEQEPIEEHAQTSSSSYQKTVRKPEVKERLFGKYSIKAEKTARDLGCRSESGSIVVGNMVKSEYGVETYEFACSENQLLISCQFSVCEVL